MKVSFSTLACPDWPLPQIIAIACSAGYDGIELRFVEGEDLLWRLPIFSGKELPATRRALSDHGLTISCLDTSCRFHSPDAAERERWLAEGKRMADLATALGAPGLRIFGDTIQPGADRPSTRSWIAESIRELAENTGPKGVEVWLETHADFASAGETMAILAEAACPQSGAVWDPANCFLEAQERPGEGAARLGASIRHVHIKDLRPNHEGWEPALTGEGDFPLAEVRAALRRLGYDRFVSFEWEKKWHPEIADAEIALPHFMRWFRENWDQ
ncbi:MAG: sugar phosphate isomerase/epimerase family protein [Terriglobales bacterium]